MLIWQGHHQDYTARCVTVCTCSTYTKVGAASESREMPCGLGDCPRDYSFLPSAAVTHNLAPMFPCGQQCSYPRCGAVCCHSNPGLWCPVPISTRACHCGVSACRFVSGYGCVRGIPEGTSHVPEHEQDFFSMKKEVCPGKVGTCAAGISPWVWCLKCLCGLHVHGALV